MKTTCTVNVAKSWERVASVSCDAEAVGRVVRPHSPAGGGTPVCVGHRFGWGANESFVPFAFFTERLARNR